MRRHAHCVGRSPGSGMGMSRQDESAVGRYALDVGRWTLDVGRWTLDVGRWTLDVGCWTTNDRELPRRTRHVERLPGREAVLGGPDGDLGAGANVQLVHDVGDVAVDGPLGDDELLGDGSVGEAL